MLSTLIPNFEDELERIRAIAPSGFLMGFNFQWRGFQHFVFEYPPVWQKLYQERNYFLSDPVLRWTIVGEGYKRWSEIQGADPLRVMREAQKFGLVYGAAFTKRGGAKRSFLSVARADRELTDIELELLDAKFAGFVDSVLRKGSLSEGELKVLALMRDGYEQQEVAALVGISKSAVKQRVQKACLKLNARNSAQAIAICVARSYFES